MNRSLTRALRWTVGAALVSLLAGVPACSQKKDDFNAAVGDMIKQLAGPKPEEAAAHLFDVTSPDERRDAIAYFTKQKYGHEPPYMKAYTMLATDPHPMVRAQAMQALGSAKSPAVVPTLLKGLEDKDDLVRADAAAGLISSFTDEAVSPLVEHLKSDESTQTRINCAGALSNTSRPEAIRALIDALDDRNAGVIYVAHQSLQKVTHQRIAMESRQWLHWYNSQPWAAATAPAPQG